MYVTPGGEGLTFEMAPSEEEAVGPREGALGLNASPGIKDVWDPQQCICP